MSTRFEQKPFHESPCYGRSYVYAVPAAEDVCDDVWKINGTWRKGFWNYNKFLQSLAKAQRSGYSRFVLCELAQRLPEFQEMIREIKVVGLRPVLQIAADRVVQESFVLQNQIEVERWVVDRWPDWSWLQSLQKITEVRLKILGTRTNPCLYQLDQIPENFRATTEFYFPYHLEKKQKMRPRDVDGWQKYVQKNWPQFKVSSASGVDIYEPRLGENLELEPCHSPILCSHPSLQPLLTVIIPSYNNCLYLLNTLRHLEQQTLAKNQYEVVVVDDGSCDKMSEGLVELVKDFKMPIRFLYYPRMKQRKMGDNQFRAGLARNYGVKFARGELLVFLDSDILTPADFLQKTLELHAQHDVVQWRREYFHKDVPSVSMHYGEVTKKQHCYIPEGGYWHQFYESAEKNGWKALPDYWKYGCTYAFSLKKSLFKDAGWFRKTFCFYGLEDTDLTWRLAQRGCSFYLEPTPVYHLFHENSRSEYFNSAYKRQKLLKATSEIFFYNNLSPDIYRVFQYLLNSWIF